MIYQIAKPICDGLTGIQLLALNMNVQLGLDVSTCPAFDYEQVEPIFRAGTADEVKSIIKQIVEERLESAT